MMLIELRELSTISDIELLFEWRNNKDNLTFFLEQSEIINWNEHLRFWLNRVDRFDRLIFYDNKPIGHISLKNLDTDVPEIGILIGYKEFRGKGIATKAISLILLDPILFEKKTVIARINSLNKASIKLFEKMGFIQYSNFKRDQNDWLVFKKDINLKSTLYDIDYPVSFDFFVIDPIEYLNHQGLIRVYESSEYLIPTFRRVYIISNVEKGGSRGFHAHKENEQLLICVSGAVEVNLTDLRIKDSVILDSPNKVLPIGKLIWHTISFLTNDVVLLVLASDNYDEKDYIRDYNEYKEFIGFINNKEGF